MPALISPTTELEAVNECLANIGQAPVSTISGDLGVDTQIALSFVRSVNRELQSQGWFWNTEINYPLTPNGDGDIILPSNTLSVDSTGVDSYLNVVQRGQRLYNRDTFSYTFTDPVYTELVVGLTFEQLPETARRYISLRAARLFQERVDDSVSQTDMTDEVNALSVLKAEQLRNEDVNMLSGSWSVFSTLRRTV
jgi:hypothetical protein